MDAIIIISIAFKILLLIRYALCNGKTRIETLKGDKSADMVDYAVRFGTFHMN